MHTRFFSKNKVKGYLRYTGTAVVAGLIEGVGANAAASAMFTHVLDREGHDMMEAMYRGGAGSACLWGVAGLYGAYRASGGNYFDRDQSIWEVGLKIAVMGILSQMLGFLFLQNRTNMSFRDSMSDIGFGTALTLLPLMILAFNYLDEIVDFMEKPFMENEAMQQVARAQAARMQRPQIHFNPPLFPAHEIEMVVVNPSRVHVEIAEEKRPRPKM